jgi:hypothetical protein
MTFMTYDDNLVEKALLLRSQLLILDFVRESNETEVQIRKSDVVKAVKGNRQKTTNALAQCIEERWLEVEKVSLTFGRPSELVFLTAAGKMMLLQKSVEVAHAKANPAPRRTPSHKDGKKVIFPGRQPVVVVDSDYGKGSRPGTSELAIEFNSRQEATWVDHVFTDDDLHWQNFEATQEIIDAYGGQAVEFARYYGARYGEKVVTIESTLRHVAPEDWALYTVEQVAMILTVAEMCHCVRSTFFFEAPARREERPLVNWYYWHVVAEAPVLDYVARTGRDNVLAMYSHWGQNLY